MVLRNDGKLKEQETVYVQLGVLYTSSKAERKIRVINGMFNSTSNLNTLFKNADLDAML